MRLTLLRLYKAHFTLIIAIGVFPALFIYLMIDRYANVASPSVLTSMEHLISNTSGASQPGPIPKYGIFELPLTATGNYANPYLQMPGDDTSRGFVVGTFTGPGGKTIIIDGFWDGGNSWKIRMAPTVVGDWSYKTSSPD